MREKVLSLVDDVLEFVWSENPVEATLAGIHRYDDRMERLDLVSRRNKLRRKKEYLEQIESMGREGAKIPELELLGDALSVGIRLEEDSSSLDRDASTYPRLALYGLYQLIARSSAPYHFRALRAVDRLREIPRLLAEGKLNISYGDNVPHILTVGAAELTVAAREYLSQLIDLLVAEVPDLESVVRKYAEHAMKALEEYLEFLIEEVQPNSNGISGVGEELFNFLLAREYHVDMDENELRGMAQAEESRAVERLRELSGVEGDEKWKDVCAALRDTSEGGDVLEFWKSIIDEVRRALRSAGLITMPADEQLVVCETPAFERTVIPSAGYIEAPLFENDSKPFFCVTVARGGSGSRDNGGVPTRARAVNMVLRDLYPGRHILLQRRRQQDVRLAYLGRGNLIEAGWSNYVPGMVLREGLFDEPSVKLLEAHEKLLDASRTLADLDIHSRGISETRAVNRFCAVTGLAEPKGWLEIRKIAAAPGSSVGPFVGRIKIEAWRDRCRKNAGNNFTLKKFHDRLLGLSALTPVRIERRLMRSFSKRGAAR